MIFQFADPWYLLLLALLPALFFLLGRRGRSGAVRFPSTLLAAQVAAFVRRRPGHWRAALRWLALAFLILALARPQTGEELTSTRSSGLDILLAVDLSTSMWAHDFQLNGVRVDRLTAVRSVVRDFIEGRDADRLGLLAFAAQPYLVSPLTLNHDWLRRRIGDLTIGQIEDGTAIGSVIGSATRRLRELEAESRVLILLTDGANNRGQLEPLPAAEAATAYDIRIYTIGVGREGRVPYPARFGRDGQPLRNRDGSIPLRAAPSDIDLKTLRGIAAATGGRYYHATSLENLRDIYAEIDQLEKTEVELKVRRLYTDVFAYPLFAGLLLLLLDLLLRETRYRRVP